MKILNRKNIIKVIRVQLDSVRYVHREHQESTHYHKGNTCKNRLCPISVWKKSRKEAIALTVMMAYLKLEKKKEFIFLTLTAPNVPAEELNDEIKHYNHSFKKLMERKEVKNIVKGYARIIEII